MHGEIHYFPASGNFTDEDGEPLIGYYYRFADDFDIPTSVMMGPYNTGLEAEEACQTEWQQQK